MKFRLSSEFQKGNSRIIFAQNCYISFILITYYCRGLPSTFRGPHGSIEYLVEAYVGDPSIDETVRTQAKVFVESPFRDNLFVLNT